MVVLNSYLGNFILFASTPSFQAFSKPPTSSQPLERYTSQNLSHNSAITTFVWNHKLKLHTCHLWITLNVSQTWLKLDMNMKYTECYHATIISKTEYKTPYKYKRISFLCKNCNLWLNTFVKIEKSIMPPIQLMSYVMLPTNKILPTCQIGKLPL